MFTTMYFNFKRTGGQACTTRRLAAFVAALQHGYTRTGGARPFACACLIAGIDPGSGTFSLRAVWPPSSESLNCMKNIFISVSSLLFFLKSLLC
jgi:hypothetical protein